MPARIESFLSARLFLAPQIVGDYIYFISNLSGRLSLFRMEQSGSVPEPLLPPDIAMQNPHLMNGHSYYVFPKLDKIIVMLDRDGDENYQPMSIPTTGGFPDMAFGDQFLEHRVHLAKCDTERGIIYLVAESRHAQETESFQCNLVNASVEKIATSAWGAWTDGANPDHDQVIVIDGYTIGDNVLYLWMKGASERKLLYGIPLESRKEGHKVELNSIQDTHFTPGGGLLFTTSIFSDSYGLGYFQFKDAKDGNAPVSEVSLTGVVHTGLGELVHLEHLSGDRYALYYNIDGCSWLYEGVFDEQNLTLEIKSVICGQGELSNGVLESAHFDRYSDTFALSFSTATSPTQIYTVESQHPSKVIRHTGERILGIPTGLLSPGEDASFTSFDNSRISARLYLPSPALGFTGRRPLIYYIHGGPQSQERPDFAWFSMPLIQFLTLSGFAVFVPNVRGSTGYGLNFTKQVDRDWGGQDRLDHVFAMRDYLSRDERLDLSKAGVVGRSYGGYMSLMLAGRHPELWQAAVDMFGPYDLLTFADRIPESWKPYMKIAIGDPVEDRELLIERSPRTYLDNLGCPLLVIQGKNDPRVVERESHDLVEDLRSKGKTIEYLVFENEGHDVLKFENRVTCYNRITQFFQDHLSA